MISGSKGPNSIRACTIRCLTLESAGFEADSNHYNNLHGTGGIGIYAKQ